MLGPFRVFNRKNEKQTHFDRTLFINNSKHFILHSNNESIPDGFVASCKMFLMGNLRVYWTLSVPQHLIESILNTFLFFGINPFSRYCNQFTLLLLGYAITNKSTRSLLLMSAVTINRTFFNYMQPSF